MNSHFREESVAAARRNAQHAHSRARAAAFEARKAWRDGLIVDTTAGKVQGFLREIGELDSEAERDPLVDDSPSPTVPESREQNNKVSGNDGEESAPFVSADDPHTRVQCWRGIPFGADTGGANRFKAPKPPAPWQGIKDCTQYGPVAPQTTYSWTDKIIGSEDCLHLDIVRPDTDEELPVVVYLHGGSFIVGSSHMAMLQGHHLAATMNVVYVSINFRLGALGYLDLRSIPGDAVANPAVMDQLQALEWVRDNIAGFGGNPDSVTLMGESAGGAAVLTLMAVPRAHGLFHRAIAQSPPLGMIHSKTQSKLWARELVHRMALPRHTHIDALRDVHFSEVVRAGQSMMWRTRELLHMNSCYAPTVDGELIPQHPLEAFAHGNQAQVPLLVGTNSDEASFSKYFYIRESARSRAAIRLLSSFDNERATEVVQAYHGATARRDFAALVTDALFWAPSLRIAASHSQSQPTWMYRFDYANAFLKKLGLGAMHSTELGNIFGDPDASRVSMLTRRGDTSEMDGLTDIMQTQWANFIHTGSPSNDWPQYSVETNRQTQVFDSEVRIEQDPNAERRQAWESYSMEEWGRGRPELLEKLGFLAAEPDKR